MTRRKMFDRPQHATIPDDGYLILRDPEEIASEYKRVYTCVSAMMIVGVEPNLRFGTGGEDQPKWHEDEPSPLSGTYYHTEREHHCRQQDRGLVEFTNGSAGTGCVVVWAGYDQRYEEQG